MARETADSVSVVMKLRDGDRRKEREGMVFSPSVRDRMLEATAESECRFDVCLEMDDGSRIVARWLDDLFLATYGGDVEYMLWRLKSGAVGDLAAKETDARR